MTPIQDISIAITLTLDHKNVCVGETLLKKSHDGGNKESFERV